MQKFLCAEPTSLTGEFPVDIALLGQPVRENPIAGIAGLEHQTMQKCKIFCFTQRRQLPACVRDRVGFVFQRRCAFRHMMKVPRFLPDGVVRVG